MDTLLKGPLPSHGAVTAAGSGSDTLAAARAPRVWNALGPRLCLLAGCAASIAVACDLGSPAAYLQADPALARLLRGMALVKAAAVVVGLAAVYWRLGWRVRAWHTGAYLVTAWMLTGSTMLVWQLTWIPAAAVLFHAALIGLLLTAWRDDLKAGGRTLRIRR